MFGVQCTVPVPADGTAAESLCVTALDRGRGQGPQHVLFRVCASLRPEKEAIHYATVSMRSNSEVYFSRDFSRLECG